MLSHNMFTFSFLAHFLADGRLDFFGRGHRHEHLKPDLKTGRAAFCKESKTNQIKIKS